MSLSMFQNCSINLYEDYKAVHLSPIINCKITVTLAVNVKMLNLSASIPIEFFRIGLLGSN